MATMVRYIGESFEDTHTGDEFFVRQDKGDEGMVIQSPWDSSNRFLCPLEYLEMIK